jgi:hypothetical protein
MVLMEFPSGVFGRTGLKNRRRNRPLALTGGIGGPDKAAPRNRARQQADVSHASDSLTLAVLCCSGYEFSWDFAAESPSEVYRSVLFRTLGSFLLRQE